MFNDTISKRLWTATVPIKIQVLDHNITLNFNTRRLSYPSHLCARVNDILRSMERPILDQRNAWFSCRGVPIKWHYPIGLLYDQFMVSPSGCWELDLHNSNFPSEELLSIHQENSMFNLYMNTLKEADFIANGSIKRILGLSVADQAKLWSSIEESNWTDFRSIQSGIFNFDEPEKVRSIPVRVYSKASGTVGRLLCKPEGTLQDIFALANTEPQR
ncbi:autophagy protein 5 [Kappamyces sp. JEL0829]|nr:autophagy protein 5 [Kappamyces sp. JEL0829]